MCDAWACRVLVLNISGHRYLAWTHQCHKATSFYQQAQLLRLGPLSCDWFFENTYHLQPSPDCHSQEDAQVGDRSVT